MANPSLEASERDHQVKRLMAARRAVRDAKKQQDIAAEAAAHAAVDGHKRALGERGPVWWTDGVPDFNRHLVKNSPYADWYGQPPLPPPQSSSSSKG